MSEAIERTQLHLRLSLDTYEKVKKKAQAKGMTVSNYIGYIVNLDIDEITDKLDMIVRQLADEDDKEREDEMGI